MKVKTIWEYYPGRFDTEVNNLLDLGWTLVRREVFTGPINLKDTMFYAEMVMEEVPEE